MEELLSLVMEEFFQLIQYLLVANSVDIKTVNVNSGLLNFTENKLLDACTDYVQTVNKPTHICGSHMCKENFDGKTSQ